MRTTLLAAIIFIFISGMASAATLWAIDAGDWANENSCLVDTSPFACTALAYPTGGLMTVQDGAYDASTSTLYLSGGGPDNYSWWEQNTIAVYTGNPDATTLVSYSNEGMGTSSTGYCWLAGIEYVGDSLYAIGSIGLNGDNFLIRINNPGTASQTVTQIGDYLGASNSMGVPHGLCRDGSGGLIGVFIGSQYNHLYSIDPLTGNSSLLHSYFAGQVQVSFEALAYADQTLYGLGINGRLFEIDQSTYELTELGSLPSSTWTCLVAVPEPGTIVMMLGGIAALVMRLRRR